MLKDFAANVVFLTGLVVGAVSVAFPATSGAQRAGPSRIIGVYDSLTGAPMEGVRIRDVLNGTIAITTATGTANLAFLSYKGETGIIDILKLGYRAEQVIVNRADTMPITYLLVRTHELPAVVTTEMFRIEADAGAREQFEQRCQIDHASCLRESYLSERPSYSVPNLLKRADGIHVQCDRSTGTACTVGSACTWFVDGFVTPKKIAEALAPVRIEGIEIYRKEERSPPRFAPQFPSDCSIVVWTK